MKLWRFLDKCCDSTLKFFKTYETFVHMNQSIGIYTLVFRKEHKNADNMKLNEDQFSVRELERHRSSKFVTLTLTQGMEI